MGYSIEISELVLGDVGPTDNTIEAVPGSIEFSDPGISVDGHIAVVVNPPVMGFSSAPGVIGYTTVILSGPGVLNFSSPGGSAAVFSAIVDGSGASIEFTSVVTAGNLSGKIDVVPATIEFSNPGIEVSGHETIIFSAPSPFRFSGVDETSVQTGQVTRSTGAAVFAVPPAMWFSSDPEITGFETIVTPLPGAIIFSGSDIIAGEPIPGAQVSPGSIEFSTPVILISGTPRGVFGIDAELPSFEMGWFGGATIEESLPALTLSGQMLSEKLGRVKGTLPIFQIAFESGGQLSIEIPNISLELGGTTTEALQTIAADISGILPMLQARMTGIRTGVNDLDLELEMFEVVMESGDCSEIVLRYVRGDIR